MRTHRSVPCDCLSAFVYHAETQSHGTERWVLIGQQDRDLLAQQSRPQVKAVRIPSKDQHILKLFLPASTFCFRFKQKSFTGDVLKLEVGHVDRKSTRLNSSHV